jgi:hypothetical protein
VTPVWTKVTLELDCEERHQAGQRVNAAEGTETDLLPSWMSGVR